VAYPGTAKIFSVPLFKERVKIGTSNISTHILSIDRKKPFTNFGKSSRLLVRTLEIFQGTHILGASRGRLCDSSAFLFSVLSALCRCIGAYATD